MPTLSVIDILDYAKGQLKQIPANRWKGVGSGGSTLTITGHDAGIDLARGPWVKFKFKEGGAEKEIQGFRTWKKGDRIKFGAVGKMKECDDDDLDVKGALNGKQGTVICKFRFEQDGKPFSYRFEGKAS